MCFGSPWRCPQSGERTNYFSLSRRLLWSPADDKRPYRPTAPNSESLSICRRRASLGLAKKKGGHRRIECKRSKEILLALALSTEQHHVSNYARHLIIWPRRDRARHVGRYWLLFLAAARPRSGGSAREVGPQRPAPRKEEPVTQGISVKSEQGSSPLRITLGDLRGRWGKFDDAELAAIRNNADLVKQVQAKYGWDKSEAQRRVDIWADGRSL